MPLMAYSSLARGLFSGRITPQNFAWTKSTLDRACLTAYCHEPNFQRLARALHLAQEKRVSVPQLVLAFLLSSALNVFPIVGAANGDEFQENVDAFDLVLNEEERAWLDLEREHLP